VPCHYENLILQSRTILADQMDYLMAGLPRSSRVLKELRTKYSYGTERH